MFGDLHLVRPYLPLVGFSLAEEKSSDDDEEHMDDARRLLAAGDNLQQGGI